jgi:hypothetical protein
VPEVITTLCDTGSSLVELVAAEDGLLRNADAGDPVTYVDGTILARATADLKFYPYEPGGAGGLDLPCAVLTYDVPNVPGASDIPVRVCTAGKVNLRRLVIHGDPPTPITAAHTDLLRSFGIVAIDVQQLGAYDNTQA